MGLVAVLLFHEAGHAFGMRLFGYADVRMFFIPFFGAAVSGRPRGGAAWKDAVVSLLGPLPGIALAAVVLLAYVRGPSPWMFEAGSTLLFINAFNLLPFGGLDGGRFFQRVIFSRNRWLEVSFLLAGSLALAWIAVTGGMWVLLAFVIFGILGLPSRFRLLGAAARLRREHPDLPADPAALDDAGCRLIFDEARAHLPPSAPLDPRAIATRMETLLDATRKAPGVFATLVLLAVYGLAGIVTLVALVGVARMSRPVVLTPITDGNMQVELAQKEALERMDVPSPWGPRPGARWSALLAGAQRFTVERIEMDAPPDATRWFEWLRADTARRAGMELVYDEPITQAGLAGRELEFRKPGRKLLMRSFVAGGEIYVISVSAPDFTATQKRFLDSLRPRATSPEPRR